MKKITQATLIVLFMGAILTSCSKKEGCTDPAANNFNVEAETDDGSCTYEKEVEPIEENTQATITFNFTHHFDGVPVTANNFNQFNFVNANGDTMSISRLRYLVSDIKLVKPNGSIIVNEGYNLVDVTNNTGLSYAIAATDLGALAGMGFNFGFDATDNVTGAYTDLNNASWGVPFGGYHGMQLEGNYKNNGVDSVYAYHHVATKRPMMTSPWETNHIEINLPGIALNQQNVVVEIKMNIAEWFKTPNNWILNDLHSSLMMNYNAQSMMQENGYNAFSLGIVSQKK